jgi:hypothetical protein
VVFISFAQNILLFLISTPTYILLLVEKLGVDIARMDNVFPRILLGLVLVEFFADQQQWGTSVPEHILVAILTQM